MGALRAKSYRKTADQSSDHKPQTRSSFHAAPSANAKSRPGSVGFWCFLWWRRGGAGAGGIVRGACAMRRVRSGRQVRVPARMRCP
eukprot:4126859-Prymnesium_polylepis.1